MCILGFACYRRLKCINFQHREDCSVRSRCSSLKGKPATFNPLTFGSDFCLKKTPYWTEFPIKLHNNLLLFLRGTATRAESGAREQRHEHLLKTNSCSQTSSSARHMAVLLPADDNRSLVHDREGGHCDMEPVGPCSAFAPLSPQLHGSGLCSAWLSCTSVLPCVLSLCSTLLSGCLCTFSRFLISYISEVSPKKKKKLQDGPLSPAHL